jgi:HTH-type transcriptional regulator / antitoxin HipB
LKHCHRLVSHHGFSQHAFRRVASDLIRRSWNGLGIGANIRSAHKRMALSQADAAQRLGMSRATISAIENGTVGEIGIRKVMALCTLLGLEIEVVARRSRPTLTELRNEARRS